MKYSFDTPTLGTLRPASRGRLIANAGAIDLSYKNRVATAAIPHNVHVHTQYPFTVQDLQALQPALKGRVTSDEAIKIISPVKGMNFVNVELGDLESLALVGTSPKPKPRLDDDWNVGFVGSYFYVLTESSPGDGDVEKISLRARMIEGTFEDPATGSAACALTSYLALKRASSRKNFFQVTQGVEMGRHSDIEVTVTLNKDLASVEKVELGGTAVKVMEGVLEY